MEILKEAGATFEFEVESILRKDSLDIPRRTASSSAESSRSRQRFDPAHTMHPKLRESAKPRADRLDAARAVQVHDAAFNVGVAIGAVQALPPGVYIAMNGQVFDPEKARKNSTQSRFEYA